MDLFGDSQCRVCIETMSCVPLHPLSDEDTRNLFQDCTSMKIQLPDDHPQYLCEDCYTTCINWRDFKCRAIESNYRFQEQKRFPEIELILPEEDIKEEVDDVGEVIGIKAEEIVDNEYPLECVDVSKLDKEEAISNGEPESDEDSTDSEKDTDGHPLPATIQRPKSSKKSHYTRVKDLSKEQRNRFKCDECPKAFPARRDRDRHMNQHQRMRENQCQECGKCFTLKHRLESHMRTQHSTDRPLAVKSSGGQSHSCPHCEKTFKLEWELRHHLKRHLAEREHGCRTCGMTFILKARLKVHQLVHLPKEDRPYKCDQCDKTFNRKTQLGGHRRVVHTGERPYQCSICGETFPTSSKLRFHVMKHGGLLKCSQCEKTFVKKQSLEIHEQMHREEPNATCEYCGKVFYRSAELTHHLMTHNKERPLECKVCMKSYTTPVTLRNHMSAHGEKPFRFQCSKCDKSFVVKSSMQRHEQCHLTSGTVVTCEQCGKEFTRIEYYKAHLRVHTGARPHKCAFCGRAFREKRSLKNHIKREHDEAVTANAE